MKSSLRLIRSEFSYQGSNQAAWQNFLAVVRAEAARPDPLDDASALLLTEKYTANRGLYGYFTGLTGSEAAHFREVLSFSEKIPGTRPEAGERSRRPASVRSVPFCRLAERNGRISPPHTASLLLDFARAMNQRLRLRNGRVLLLDFLGAYMDVAGVDCKSLSSARYWCPAAADELLNSRTVIR